MKVNAPTSKKQGQTLTLIRPRSNVDRNKNKVKHAFNSGAMWVKI